MTARQFRSEESKLIVVDESGELGFDERSSETFVLVATITDCPDEFRGIAARYQPRGNRTELKYVKATEKIRRLTLNEIAYLDPDIRAVVVYKRDLPEHWSNLKGAKLYKRTTDTLMDDIMRDADGRYTVIFDPHKTLEKNLGCNSARKAALKYGRELVDCTQNTDSMDELAIQTHDMITGAVGNKFNRGRDADFNNIKHLSRIRIIKRK